MIKGLSFMPKLREMVCAHCHVPLLIEGSFVPIEVQDWKDGMRRSTASAEELLDALDHQLKLLKMANGYLLERLGEEKPK